MKKIVLICLVCFLSTSNLSGQKIQYGGMQQFGLNFYSGGSNPSFNLINGIRFKRFFTGIGVDAHFNQRRVEDYYMYSSFYRPVSFNTSAIYFDGRYYINKKKNFFALTNAGATYINNKLGSSDLYNYKKRPGYYALLGLGFKAKLGAEVFYSFDVSYGVRQTKYDYNYKNFITEWQTDKFDIRQHYVVVRMGFELF